MLVKKSLKMFILSLIVFSFSSTSASANYWDDTTATGGHAKVHYSASVSSYGYTSIYDSAITKWNGISSQVSVKKASPSYTTDVYYVGNTSIIDRTGFMQPMGARGEVCVNCRWTYTQVYLYDNNMDKLGFSNANRVSVAVHEIGHSLKLGHPNTTSISVMHTGRQSIIYPTAYDNSQLKAKWGN